MERQKVSDWLLLALYAATRPISRLPWLFPLLVHGILQYSDDTRRFRFYCRRENITSMNCNRNLALPIKRCHFPELSENSLRTL